MNSLQSQLVFNTNYQFNYIILLSLRDWKFAWQVYSDVYKVAQSRNIEWSDDFLAFQKLVDYSIGIWNNLVTSVPQTDVLLTEFVSSCEL